MGTEAWLAVGVVVAVVLLLARTRTPPWLVLAGGLTAVLLLGLADPAAALSGFSNPGVLTVGALFVVSAGLNQTGVLTWVVERALGRPRTLVAAQARIILPVMAGSAFLNNTPVVAMLMPVVLEWARQMRLAASKLLIPLSYAAILGGLCTLIGTSTNLVVNGLLVETGHPGLGFFDISRLGVLVAAAGAAYLLLLGRRLLPDRGAAAGPLEDPREYTAEMVVVPGGPLEGRAIGSAGLRQLPGLFLMEIHRRDRILPVVDPHERLEAGDQLVFVGVVDSVLDVQKRPGLAPATRQVFKLDAPSAQRIFAEAVISRSCPLVGKTIRDGRFRTRYNAVVIAVARNGERLRQRIGDIVLQPGDALLLEALPAFVEQHRNSSDFYLVSHLDGAGPPTRERAGVALLILAGMVLVVALGALSMLQASFLAAGAMVLTGCCSEERARRAIDWELLIAIAAAFGLGHALDQTGAAASIAHGLLSRAGSNAWLALAHLYVMTAVLTELVTNNAAAVIVFPIAMATARETGADPMPFVMSLMVAASASFATPLGYQTNLMVYGAGGYRFGDFLRVGLPLDLLVAAITVGLAPLLWPL